MATGDRAIEWRGGSLEDLLGMLSGPALAARIEVLSSDGAGNNSGSSDVVGEVHVVAGGVSEVFVGDLRGEEARARLEELAPTRFRVEPGIPDPKTGALDPPGEEEGTLADRPPAALMRYCEEYVMTCLLELWRGGDHATISYRRGEIGSTNVMGSKEPEQVPEVMTWTEGHYRIVLPPLILPAPPRPLRPSREVPVPTRPSKRVAIEDPRTLMGFGPPQPQVPPAAAAVPAAGEAFAQASPAAANARAHTATRVGLPVDVVDAAQRDRTLDLDYPAFASTLVPGTPAPGDEDGHPPLPAARPRAATPAGSPVTEARSGLSTSMLVTPAPTVHTSAVARDPRRVSAVTRSPRRAVAIRRRTLADLPVTVHVALGLALGLAVVGAYWVVQGILTH